MYPVSIEDYSYFADHELSAKPWGNHLRVTVVNVFRLKGNLEYDRGNP